MELIRTIINDASNKLTRRVIGERLCMILAPFAKRLTSLSTRDACRCSSREIYAAFLRTFDHLDRGTGRCRNGLRCRLWLWFGMSSRRFWSWFYLFALQ